MNTTQSDVNPLQTIAPAEFAAYLLGKGASKVDEYAQKAIVWKYGDEEILIPLAKRFADYTLRIAQAMRQFERVEQRPLANIVEDIKLSGFDVIRVRNVSPDTRNGTLNFSKGVEFVAQTRDMLLAAACSAATHKISYPGRKPVDAENFMQKIRFGKTEQGSFVLQVLSPVVPALNVQGTLVEMPEEEPYEKTVVPTLQSGLEALNRAAQNASGDRELHYFVNEAPNGLTTNLCDAVSGMYESLNPDYIEVSIAFSGNRPTARPLTRISIDSGYIPLIRHASATIKSTEPEPEQLVRGQIVYLESMDPSVGGEIRVKDVVSRRPRSISIQLNREEYAKAIQAHGDQHIVEFTGTIQKRGNCLWLDGPSQLDVISPEEE